jgi:small neutral amino acid transporter SnatA (MarC family)
MRTTHILAGTAAFGLGLAGIYDEYFVVIEFIKGLMQPATAALGLVAVIAGMSRRKRDGSPTTAQIVFGLAMLALAVYGFYDEFFAVMDFFKGSVPLLMIGGGLVAVFSGINKLRVPAP